MADTLVPVTSDPNQSFPVTLNINNTNKDFILKFRYNSVAEYWIMDILDATTNEYFLSSIPLVPGNYPAGNLLSQYNYLKIGSAYIIPDGQISEQYPSEYTLGAGWSLVWSDN